MKKLLFYIIFSFIFFNLQSTCFAKEIPQEWFVFQAKTVPFIPFNSEKKKLNYEKKLNKIYQTPLNIEKYAENGWIYNENYKPYEPGKFLWAVSDYTYETYLKNTNKSDKYCVYSPDYSEEKCSELRTEYNEWLWNKIRSDYRSLHSIYSTTLTDSAGNKTNYYKEDGGIISIYEQRNVFFEYQKPLPNELIEEKHLKFLQNFRFNYKDIRVNNPYLEFVIPKNVPNGVKWFTNQLYVIIHQKDRIDLRPYPYTNRYQKEIKYYEEPYYTLYSLEKELNGIWVPSEYIGPDNKLYSSVKFPSEAPEYELFKDKGWSGY